MKYYIVLFILFLIPFIPHIHSELLWYDEDWQYKKAITINSTNVQSNLVNFPLLVNITDTDLTANAQADCDDILFTDRKNIKIPHEIEICELTQNDHIMMWVNVPLIVFTEDSLINMYYGNPSATSQEDISNTWNSNFISVHHLNDTNYLDSTSNNNHGTLTGTVTVEDVYLSEGLDFEGHGGNDRIFLNHREQYEFGNSSTFTISAWINTTEQGFDMIGMRGNSLSSGDHGYGLGMDSGENALMIILDGSLNTLRHTAGAIDDGEFHLVMGSYAGTGLESGMCASKDGEPIACSTSTTPITNDMLTLAVENFTIGAESDGGSGWQKHIDEVRVMNIVQSEAWHIFEYCNQTPQSVCQSINVGEQTENIPYNVITLSLADPSPSIKGGALSTELSNVLMITNDVSIQSDTTFGDISDDFCFDVTAGKSYLVYEHYFFTSDPTADIQWLWSLPSGTTGLMNDNDWQPNTPVTTKDITANRALNTAGTDQTIARYGMMHIVNDGEVCQQWKQTTSQAIDTTIYKGSFIVYREFG